MFLALKALRVSVVAVREKRGGTADKALQGESEEFNSHHP